MRITLSAVAIASLSSTFAFAAGSIERLDLPAVLAELKAKGVKMAFDLRVTPTEDFAFISDNAGNAIELIEHKTQ